MGQLAEFNILTGERRKIDSLRERVFYNYSVVRWNTLPFVDGMWEWSISNCSRDLSCFWPSRKITETLRSKLLTPGLDWDGPIFIREDRRDYP